MPTNTILKFLSDNEKAFISQIAEGTGLSVPTTTKYLGVLEDAGLVRKSGKVEVHHGRRPVMYRLNEEAAFFLGVDPKRHSLEMSICDLTGRTVREVRKELPFENTPEIMERICSSCEDFIGESGIDSEKIKVIAFNLSGRVNPKTGFSHSVFNFENQDEPLSEILSQRLSHKVIIENDTRAMAYGELHSVIKDRYKNFLFVNIGWGVGLSIVIDGKLYYGMSGYSGEFGHTNAYDNEIMCHCGKKGCLETVVSGRAICSQFTERVMKGESSVLAKDVLKGKIIRDTDIIYAANHDDTLAMDVIENAGKELGKHIANLINIFNPEAVIVGGSLGLAGDFFLQALQLSIKRYSLRLMSKGLDIIQSELGDKAGVIGACLQARDAFLSDARRG